MVEFKFSERGVALCNGAMHFKSTASCAMMFRESTAMLVKPVMGHSLQGHPKLKLPLVAGLGKTLEERPEA